MRAWRSLSLAEKYMAGVLLLTAAVYLPFVFMNEFVSYDDGLLITQNPRVTQMTALSLWEIFTSYDPELYVPLTLLTYKLEYALFGAWPVAYHFTNLVLHLLASWLVFRIIGRLAAFRFPPSTAAWVGLGCAVLFALHPINTETVLWAAARKDVLSGGLFLLAFWLYLKKNGSSKTELAVYAAALISKVSVLLYPVVLLATDWYTGRGVNKRTIAEKWPHFGLSAVFGLVALYGKRYELNPLSFPEQLALGAKSAFFYVWQFFFPTRLAVLHPQPYPFELTDPTLWVPLAGTALVLLLMAVEGRKRRTFTYGVLFFVCLLLPSIATFWRNGWVVFASERYVYLAQIGLLFPLLAFLVKYLQRIRGRTLYVALFLLVGLISAVTVVQAGTWQNSLKLYRRVLAVYPDSSQAMNNLATDLYLQGEPEEALRWYKHALVFDPHLPQVQSNRGIVLLKLGRREEALEAFQAGMEAAVHPDVSYSTGKPYLLYARELQQIGRTNQALEVLEQAIDVDPRNEEIHYNLGILYQQRQDFAAAEAHFQAAARSTALRVDANYRLAAVLAAQGKIQPAINALQKVQRYAPGYQDTERHLQALEEMVE